MGLRGAGIWALGYDADRVELRQAIAEKFLNDKTLPLAGVRAFAPSQTTETFTVSWVGRRERRPRHDLQVSIHGGPWHDWLIHTTATSAPYAGADGTVMPSASEPATRRATSGRGTSPACTTPRSLSRRQLREGRRIEREHPLGRGISKPLVTTADAGTILAVTGGPVSADGYTWYEVSLPISEWAPVAGVRTNVWVASSSTSSTLVAAVGAPNSTVVDLPAGVAPTVGARFVGINPARLLDTRFGVGLAGSFANGTARTFPVAGRGGVPSNAVAVTGTLTVVGQTSAGYVSLGPSAATVARSSVVNAPLGDVRASGVTVKLGGGGSLAALWTGADGSRANLIFDVSGYFVPGATGATYVPLTPARILDTRTGSGLTGLFTSGAPRSFAVARPRRRSDERRGGDGQPDRRRADQRRLPLHRPGGRVAATQLEPQRHQGRHPRRVGDRQARRQRQTRRRLAGLGRREGQRPVRRHRLLRQQLGRRDVVPTRTGAGARHARGQRLAGPFPRNVVGRSRRPVGDGPGQCGRS